MRILIFGNSGSGKSHLAKRLAREHSLPHLDLDTIVWEPGKIAVQRDMESVRGDLARFITEHSGFVIEGCYGELIEWALPHCDELVFMNPGLETCVENNRRRPWEQHKYASNSAQQRMLPMLLSWVEDYYRRDDAWSLSFHRRLFDSFTGRKREVTTQDSTP